MDTTENSAPLALPLADWLATRDTLHGYARLLGKIRASSMPTSKHWWHITLSVTARGLTTTPFPLGGQSVEMHLDLLRHELVVDSSAGWTAACPLTGQSPSALSRWIGEAFATAGLALDAGVLAGFDATDESPYDGPAAERYRQVLGWVDAAFKRFKGGLREETSPVHLFPHHMDLALTWFSGRLVPGADPADEGQADEQLGFGFVTGDGGIADAYFYATAYPAPDSWADLELPAGAYWHTEGWTGAVLPYAEVVASAQPLDLLLDYLRRVQRHGAGLMV